MTKLTMRKETETVSLQQAFDGFIKKLKLPSKYISLRYTRKRLKSKK